jgi:AraC-like DNA-binding protein
MTARAKGFHLRYAGPAKGPDYERWRANFGTRWIAADFDPIGASHIDNEIIGTHHNFLTICTQRSTPSHMVSRTHLVADPEPYVYLLIASDAPLAARFHGRTTEIGVGQLVLLSADDRARVTQVATGTRTSIRLPRQLVSDFSRRLDDKLAHPVSADNAVAKLLLHQVELARQVGPTLDSAANHAIAQHILDLVGLCIGADRDAAEIAGRRGLSAARLEAIKDDVLRRLGGTGCELPSVAARHGVSTRYVQHLFERSGSSFTNFVREQRLLTAHRLLRDPKNGWRKISDIALAVGFSDLSYFHRAFKTRFGATPSDIRRAEAQR